jgi:hypothetical protein
MYATPLVAILFPLLIVGIPITMLMSYIFVESPGTKVQGDHPARAASVQDVRNRSISTVSLERAA